MSEICGENYEIQCGEVFLHLMNGKLSFHCTLCENKYNGFQNYADHVASEHSPSLDWEDDDEVDVGSGETVNEYELEGIVTEQNIKKEIPIKEESESTEDMNDKESCIFNENSYNSFADEYEEVDRLLLNELEVNPEDLTDEIFVDSKPTQRRSNMPAVKKRGRGTKPEPVIIPTDDARPVKIKYINKDDERKFRCPNCDFSCKLKRNLKGHLRRHAKEKPFQCTSCEKGFYTTTELRVHSRIHTGERPYVCLECGDGFVTLAKLNEHRKIHDSSAPRFQCTECGKIFNAQARLRAHSNSCIHKREKPHKCTKCKAGFEHLIDLKNHCQLHESKKIYECVICDARFNERPSLNLHLKTKHMNVYI